MKRLYAEYFLLILGLVVGFTWFVYPQLPEVMVTHWGLAGQANGWMSRAMGAWILPLIMGGLWFWWEIKGTADNNEFEAVDAIQPQRLLVLFIFIFLGSVQVMMLGVNLGWRMDVAWVLGWLLVVLTAVLGQLLPVIPRNYFVGVRTPWSLNSNGVWKKTHREVGRWCRGAALLDIILLLALKRPWGMVAVTVSLLICLGWGVFYSYVYRRH